MPETYSLLSQFEASPYSFLSDLRPVQSADQLIWKPKPFQNANLYVTVSGGFPGLKTKTVSTLTPKWTFESKFWTDSRSTELTIQLFHNGLRKDKLLGKCKHTIEDLLQPAAAEQTAVAVDLNLGKEHAGKLWVRLTLDRGINELAIPASTHAAPTLSDTHSDDAHDEWKKVICEKAKRTWQGLDWITKTIAPIVPQPFRGPLELFNAISDVAAKYIDNEEKLKNAIEKLSARLVEVNSLLLESDSYNIDITESSQQLASLVVAEALKMENIQKSHPVKKIPQHKGQMIIM
ncbi:hypothetical protein B0H14DRAFT_3694974 [Mycena olivaceomarginata]|nr:hypothetical protein B0H14DRAFT_3694974 [Mycena olivaceomarginata]